MPNWLVLARFIYLKYTRSIRDVYMVQAVIDIDVRANRVLNIVKAKFGLKDKSEAINIVVKEYEETLLEPELRPEYEEKLNKIRKGKYIKYNSIEELRRAMS